MLLTQKKKVFLNVFFWLTSNRRENIIPHASCAAPAPNPVRLTSDNLSPFIFKPLILANWCKLFHFGLHSIQRKPISDDFKSLVVHKNLSYIVVGSTRFFVLLKGCLRCVFVSFSMRWRHVGSEELQTCSSIMKWRNSGRKVRSRSDHTSTSILISNRLMQPHTEWVHRQLLPGGTKYYVT